MSTSATPLGVSNNLNASVHIASLHFPRIAEIIHYVKLHEKLVALALALLVCWFGYGKFVDYADRRDTRNTAVEQERLKQQVAQNTALAEQNAKAAADYKQLAEQVLAQNTALNQAIAARDVATSNQQNMDRTLPPDALANRWQTLLNLPPLSVQPTSQGFTILAPAAIETVVQLESIPQLKADLKDSQTQAGNIQQEVVKGNGVISGLNTQISGLNGQIIQEDKTCKAEISLVKDDARKAKRNRFIAGLITGATVVGYLLHH